LGTSWAPLGASWALLGPNFEPLGHILGNTLALLGTSWAALGVLWRALGALGHLLGATLSSWVPFRLNLEGRAPSGSTWRLLGHFLPAVCCTLLPAIYSLLPTTRYASCLPVSWQKLQNPTKNQCIHSEQPQRMNSF